MKNKQLRNKIVDCLRFYKKSRGYWEQRSFKETDVHEWRTSEDGLPSVKQILDFCEENCLDINKILVDGGMNEDWDGYPEYCVILSERTKQSDKEWFDEICNALSPQWEYDRYKQYVELQKEYHK